MIAAALAVLVTLQAAQAPGPVRAAIQAPQPSLESMAADTGTMRHRSGRTPPVARGTRLEGPAPHIDGRLDDAAWNAATPITELYQNEPHEGQPASERTEVRILYDGDAIYVGARMFDSTPALVRTQLARRDNISNSDYISIAFDSYHDHRTTFRFEVNPSGVRGDLITTGDNRYGDDSWDPVWDASARRDSLGWSAEMRIPLSQLRFPPSEEQVWGVNIQRWIQRKAENAEFAWKQQTEQGNASYFGHLFGLRRLPQPRRLEVLPYVSTRQAYSASVAGDPFNDGARAQAAAGMDLKYGVTSNITVDATFNPDFGQVEQDPAFVNLSAFEQFLQERRPFFVEGADIFRFGGSQFFYSRRVGRPPRGSADDHTGFVDIPENSTILGAAKVTGRTGGGWSLGLLEAVTARENATIDSSGTRFSEEVEPLTNYAVGRVKRDLRGGSTQVGGMFTAVNRDLSEPDLRFLRSAAYAGGADFTHRFDHNRYSLSGSIAGSYIHGDTLAIQAAQQSSARYYQRPDADYVDYDPRRTSLTGWSGRLAFARTQGNWTYRLAGNATSPGFELNDAGFMRRGDSRSVSGNLQRRWTRPGKLFRNATWGGDLEQDWNFGGVRTSNFIGSYLFGQFLNYWSVNASVAGNGRTYSDVLTRGGPLGYNSAGVSFFLGVNSDFRKRIQAFVGTDYFTNRIGAWSTSVFADVTMRPAPNIQLSLSPSWNDGTTVQQYLLSQPDPLNTAMYGNQYVFAEIRQHSLDITTRINVTFSPALSLQLYTQPFIATGSYSGFKELTAPGSNQYLRYGETSGSTLDTTVDANGAVLFYTGDPDGAGPRPAVVIGNPDFSVRSLRGNAVVRWEYRPGSTLFFVWTQSCGYFSQRPAFAPGSDFGHLCQGKSTNAFAVKLNYWLSL